MLDTVKPKWQTTLLFLLIPVVFYVFTVFVPLVAAFVYSFYDKNAKDFVGFANYGTLIADKVFWSSFGHNIYLIIACIIGQIGIAFIFVLIINSKLTKLKNIHRTFVFFPSTIAAVALALIWKMIYDYQHGILNSIISTTTGTPMNQLPVWLNNDKGNIMLLVAIPLIWQYIGYYMVILFSAIATVDTEIFEVAELDGANAFQRAVYIVFPLIKDTIMVCVTLCVAGNMKAFDIVYALTAGGPGNASMVMALHGYNTAFKQNNLGYGSAISIGIFILSLAIIVLSQSLPKILSKKEVEAK